MISLGINEEHQFQALARVLGRADWLADPRFTDRAARTANADALEAMLLEALAERTAIEWEEAMQAGGVPAARVRTLPEALDDPQISARRYLHGYGGEGDAAVTVPTLPFRIGNRDVHATDQAPPRRGQHSVEILRELDVSEGRIGQLLADGIVEQAG
jgi:CoA:oxalate CoA-transferase